jgi:tungstate transport system ATP-binding protein
MAETSVLLGLAGVTVSRDGAQLLADVQLTVTSGERVVVLGANGAGKSTLLKVANGVLVPDHGRVDSPPRTAQAHVFQRPAVLARSVFANVQFVLAAQGLTNRNAVRVPSARC